MMSRLRENAKFILWFVIGAFIITIVAVWGLKGQVSKEDENPDVIAKIGKESVGSAEFGETWRNKQQDMYEKGIKLSDEKELAIKKELLNEIIDNRLKLDYAKTLGIITSDEEVAENLMSIPAFNTKDGQFDKQQYLNYLASQRIQPEEFEEQQRKYITMIKLRNQLWSEIKFTGDELKTYFLKRERSLKSDYVYFNYKNFISSIRISDDKLTNYYAMHRKEYEKPDRVKASHILIQADASPTSPTGLTESAALKLAQETMDKIKAGGDFAAMARKYSKDPGSAAKGGDLGWFAKGAMVPEFEKAAFATPKGGISEVIKTQFGYHIIKVVDKESGFTPTYAKVKDQVLKSVQKTEGMDLMKKKAEKMASEIVNPVDFDRVAAANTITVRSLVYITEDSKPAEIESSGFKDQLFDLNNGAVSKVIDGDNGYYIFRVTGELPAKFDEAKFKKKQADLEDKLRNIKFDQVQKDTLSIMKKQVKIEVFDKNL
jgi:peptidyl-prolyl cis-trans isomerase D